MRDPKMLRQLRLLVLLTGSKRYSANALAEKFDCSERTIYRHLDEIEAAGFLLNRENGYNLMKDHSQTRTLKALFHFSEEEVVILYRALRSVGGSSKPIRTLIHKLNAFYDLRAVERLRQNDELEKVQTIASSIDSKTQLILRNYRSGNSNKIEDRKVEVFDFLPDYEALWCYDLRSHSVKQFRLSRMEGVELAATSWQHEDRHKKPFTDAFRISAPSPIARIQLELSLRAYNLLLEEYPMSKDFICMEDGYRLDIEVAGFEGVGRFVLGLPDDVVVGGNAEFKEYIQKKAESHMEKRFFTTDRI